MMPNLYHLPQLGPTEVHTKFGSWYRAEWRRVWREIRYLLAIGWFRVTDLALERISTPRAPASTDRTPTDQPKQKDSHQS